jgi:fatty-acyl-CoA synthase
MRDWDPETLNGRVRHQAALPLAGVKVRLCDDEGNAVPWDGRSMGRVLLRGPWIAGSYLGEDAATGRFTPEGYFDTGDVAIGSPDGYLVIADRTKDLVKSGGEWISSVDMENAIVSMPQVLEAAVVAVPDPRWDERPLACVVAADHQEVTLRDVREHLGRANFPRWQWPDRMELLDTLPRTSVGKVDKKALRAQFESGQR